MEKCEHVMLIPIYNDETHINDSCNVICLECGTEWVPKPFLTKKQVRKILEKMEDDL